MPHRNPFKPHADHPSLDEVMEERSVIDIRNAVRRAFAGDAKRVADLVEPESLSHGG